MRNNNMDAGMMVGGSRPSLLGLPAEIRNLIWEYTFSPPSPRDTTTVAKKSRSTSPASWSSYSSSSSSSVPADDTHECSNYNNSSNSNVALGTYPTLSLLLTCRQIRSETVLLAFTRTPFRTKLCRPAALTTRLAVLSPAQVRAVRTLTFTTAAAATQLGSSPQQHQQRVVKQQWEGDMRPLLFPVYVQCRKLLWEAVRLLPEVCAVDFVLGEERVGAGASFGKGGPGGGMRQGRTVGGAKFFFDTVVGVGLKERNGRGETHAWGDRWQVIPGAEGEERCIWLVEDAGDDGGQQCAGGSGEERRVAGRGEGRRWVRVEIVRLPLGG